MAGNSGGPWGGGSGGGGGGNGDDPRGRRPGEGPQLPPEIDQMMKKGQEQLRVLMGGGGKRPPNGNGGGGSGFGISRRGLALAGVALVAGWLFLSFYTVRQEERSVELLFGQYHRTGQPGLNFAPWPFVTKEIFSVTGERTLDIGSAARRDEGLMLTRDENLVDTEFQVVWNISNPDKYLFNLADPADTIRAVAESAMRDIIARSEMAPILNRDRGVIAADLQEAVQATLDTYDSGINIIRVNFDRADPPAEVIDSFRQVQAARQERDRLQNQADAYANRVLAGARGDAARVLEEAEGYRAQAVNSAQGEASRFLSVFEEYRKAPDVTRKRMYLETMEKVFGRVDKTIVDGVTGSTGQGVLPILPLEPTRPGTAAAAATTAAGGNN